MQTVYLIHEITENQLTVSGVRHFRSSCCPGIDGKVYGCNKHKIEKNIHVNKTYFKEDYSTECKA